MTWPDARDLLAKQGVPVRRAGWAASKSLVYSAGPGSTPAVPLLTAGTAVRVPTFADFGVAEWTAIDWGKA
jgi:hypothetical protein